MNNFVKLAFPTPKAVVLFAFIIVFIYGCATQMESKRAADETAMSQAMQIEQITFDEAAGAYDVHIKGSGPLTFTSVKQPLPLGVILYFPDTTVAPQLSDITSDSDVITSIKAAEVTNDGQTSRVEILLKKDIPYQVQREDDGLKVVFKSDDGESSPNRLVASASGEVPAAEASAPNESSLLTPVSVQQTATETPEIQAPIGSEADETLQPIDSPATEITVAQKDEPVVPTAEEKTGRPAWMNRIDFSSEEKGQSTLVIGTTVPVIYQMDKLNGKTLQLKLLNTSVPKYRQRPLITTRFNSAVDRVIPFQKPGMEDYSLVSIELREEVPYRIDQTGNIIMVYFDPSSIPPRPLAQANLPDWRQMMSDPAATAVAEPAPPSMASEALPADIEQPADTDVVAVSPIPTESKLSVLSSRKVGGEKRYKGEKIALDFYKTDIKNVFRILREVSGKNFAVDKDVAGSVTMTLDKPVPWDQVLELVLKMNQLGVVMENDIVRIATLETLKHEEDLRNQRMEAAKKAAEQEKALEPLFTEYIPVNYSIAKTEVLPHIEKILTKDRGSVSVDERNNQIIFTDTAEKIKQARELVKRIDKVTPQVIIEARVVEVTNSFSKELGIDWDVTYGPGHNSTFDVDATGDMAMNFPAASAPSSIGFNFSRLSGVPFVLNAKLNALETNGNGRILSAPKILTLDNKKAMIKQGVEFPYLERDDAGGSSVRFKDIDLLLEVTPHVTPDDRISMSIFITKNDVDDITAGVPSVATNEAQTELLVNDGDTIVIGGIIKSSKNKNESGFPVLSRIPILGWMFKTQTQSDRNNELLIFITPRIVQLEQRMASF
jgi:type IV pilus assembly protein PilQ